MNAELLHAYITNPAFATWVYAVPDLSPTLGLGLVVSTTWDGLNVSYMASYLVSIQGYNITAIDLGSKIG